MRAASCAASQGACAEGRILVVQEFEEAVEEANELRVLADTSDVPVSQDRPEEPFRVADLACQVGSLDPQWLCRFRLGEGVHGVAERGEDLVAPPGVGCHAIQRPKRGPEVFSGLFEGSASQRINAGGHRSSLDRRGVAGGTS